MGAAVVGASVPTSASSRSFACRALPPPARGSSSARGPVARAPPAPRSRRRCRACAPARRVGARAARARRAAPALRRRRLAALVAALRRIAAAVAALALELVVLVCGERRQPGAAELLVPCCEALLGLLWPLGGNTCESPRRAASRLGRRAPLTEPRRHRYIPHLPLELLSLRRRCLPHRRLRRRRGVAGAPRRRRSGEGVVVVDLDADAIRVAGGALRLPDGAARDAARARAARRRRRSSTTTASRGPPAGVKARSAPGGGAARARLRALRARAAARRRGVRPALDLDGSRRVAPRAAAAPRRRKLSATSGAGAASDAPSADGAAAAAARPGDDAARRGRRRRGAARRRRAPGGRRWLDDRFEFVELWMTLLGPAMTAEVLRPRGARGGRGRGRRGGRRGRRAAEHAFSTDALPAAPSRSSGRSWQLSRTQAFADFVHHACEMAAERGAAGRARGGGGAPHPELVLFGAAAPAATRTRRGGSRSAPSWAAPAPRWRAPPADAARLDDELSSSGGFFPRLRAERLFGDEARRPPPLARGRPDAAGRSRRGPPSRRGRGGGREPRGRRGDAELYVEETKALLPLPRARGIERHVSLRALALRGGRNGADEEAQPPLLAGYRQVAATHGAESGLGDSIARRLVRSRLTTSGDNQPRLYTSTELATSVSARARARARA